MDEGVSYARPTDIMIVSLKSVSFARPINEEATFVRDPHQDVLWFEVHMQIRFRENIHGRLSLKFSPKISQATMWRKRMC